MFFFKFQPSPYKKTINCFSHTELGVAWTLSLKNIDRLRDTQDHIFRKKVNRKCTLIKVGDTMFDTE